MIKDSSGKTAGYVTDTAVIGRRYMIDMLTDCRNTIVAGSAVTDYTGMIEYRAGETGCAMTNAAVLVGGDVRRRLCKGADCIVCAIVARETIRRDTGMSEYRRIEC